MADRTSLNTVLIWCSSVSIVVPKILPGVPYLLASTSALIAPLITETWACTSHSFDPPISTVSV